MNVWVTGGRGMLGAAVTRALRSRGVQPVAPTSAELDLTREDAVRAFIAANSPDAVVHTAGRVGGIAANVADPVGFLTENMSIGMNVISACHRAGVPRLINVSSSCMYPKDLDRPLVENDVLTGPLEPTNEGYALAKIASDRLCAYIAQTTQREYRTIVPSNLYGPGDHFDEQRGHLVANAIRKIEVARRGGLPAVEVWGDGTARREFTYVDDVADWLAALTIDGAGGLPLRVNAGVGVDYTVREYYEHISRVCGYAGDLSFDVSKPAGMARKLMDSGLARAHGWTAPTSLDEGLARTVEYYREQVVSG